MKHKWLEFCFWRCGAWVRLFGYGLHFQPSKESQLFSERYGYAKAFYFGTVRVGILKPVWRKQGGF